METEYKEGDIVEMESGFKVEILKVFSDGYEWRYHPKQSENYYHTDWAGSALLYKESSSLINT